MNESFIYYKSFYEATEDLTDEQFGRVMRALTKYALAGEEPQNMDAVTKLAFMLMKPQVDANERRRKNGNGGGRPKTETKPNHNRNVTEQKPKANQTITETKPNHNRTITETKPNVNVNVNANEKVNVNDNANVNENVNVSPTGEKEKVDSYESTEKKAAQSSEEVTVEDAMIGLGFSPDLEAALKDWCGYKAERHEKYKPLGLKSLITQVANNARQYGDIAVVRAIRDSMASGYKGIVFDKLRASPSGDLSHDEFVDRWRNV